MTPNGLQPNKSTSFHRKALSIYIKLHINLITGPLSGTASMSTITPMPKPSSCWAFYSCWAWV